AVNNEETGFPKVTASYTHPKTGLKELIDGNFWYDLHPPNRWTCEGSQSAVDWCVLDFGTRRRIDTIKLYLLDDGKVIVPPAKIELQRWSGTDWEAIPQQTRIPAAPEGRRANRIDFPPLETAKIRAVFTHAKGGRTGLTE